MKLKRVDGIEDAAEQWGVEDEDATKLDPKLTAITAGYVSDAVSAALHERGKELLAEANRRNPVLAPVECENHKEGLPCGICGPVPKR